MHERHALSAQTLEVVLVKEWEGSHLTVGVQQILRTF